MATPIRTLSPGVPVLRGGEVGTRHDECLLYALDPHSPETGTDNGAAIVDTVRSLCRRLFWSPSGGMDPEEGPAVSVERFPSLVKEVRRTNDCELARSCPADSGAGLTGVQGGASSVPSAGMPEGRLREDPARQKYWNRGIWEI